MIRLGHNFSLALVILLSSVFGQASGQDFIEFETHFGGPWSDGAQSIVRMSDDGFALGGWKASEGEPESADGWIVRVDSRGRYLWDLPLVTAGSHGIRAMSPAFDGGLFVIIKESTELTAQVRLVKVSPMGNVEWSKNYRGLGIDQIAAVHPTFDGGVIMAGTTALEDGEITSGWIFKLDRTYETQWIRTIRRDHALRVNDIALLEDGGFVGVGSGQSQSDRKQGWAIKLNSLGATVWEQFHDFGPQTGIKKALALSDGRLAFIANISNELTGEQKMVIGSLMEDGLQAWIEEIDISGSTMAHDLARNGLNAFLAAASIEDESGLDGLIVEFNANGRIGSAFRQGGSRSVQAFAISSAVREAYAVAGVVEEPGSGNQDVWLLVRRNMVQSPISSQGSEQ